MATCPAGFLEQLVLVDRGIGVSSILSVVVITLVVVMVSAAVIVVNKAACS